MSWFVQVLETHLDRFSGHPRALVRAATPAELLHRCEIPNFYSSKIYRWKKGVCLQKTRWMVYFLILLPLVLHKAFWLPYKFWLFSFTFYTVFPCCDPWLPESIQRPSSSLQYPEKSAWSHLYASPCLKLLLCKAGGHQSDQVTDKGTKHILLPTRQASSPLGAAHSQFVEPSSSWPWSCTQDWNLVANASALSWYGRAAETLIQQAKSTVCSAPLHRKAECLVKKTFPPLSPTTISSLTIHRCC